MTSLKVYVPNDISNYKHSIQYKLKVLRILSTIEMFVVALTPSVVHLAQRKCFQLFPLVVYVHDCVFTDAS